MTQMCWDDPCVYYLHLVHSWRMQLLFCRSRMWIALFDAVFGLALCSFVRYRTRQCASLLILCIIGLSNGVHSNAKRLNVQCYIPQNVCTSPGLTRIVREWNYEETWFIFLMFRYFMFGMLNSLLMWFYLVFGFQVFLRFRSETCVRYPWKYLGENIWISDHHKEGDFRHVFFYVFQCDDKGNVNF